MVIPGILEQNTEKALEKIKLMYNLAPKIQLDIADGILVNGKTFMDLSFLENLAPNECPPIQLHLMVQKPEAMLMFLPSIVKEVCVQAEAFMYKPLCLEAFDDFIKAKKVRAGLSFNHTTPFEDFVDCIKQCDFVQFMTVEPGAQGRPFIVESLGKISRFKETFPNKPLQVDGGISLDIIPTIVQAGADDLIIGSALFESEEPKKSYQDFVLQYEHARTNYLNSQKRHEFRDTTYLKED